MGAVWTGVEGAVAGWVVSVASAGVAPWRAALRRAASCWIICRITADRDCCCAGCVSGFWAYAPPLSSAHPAPSDSVRIRFVADRGKTPPRPANVLGSQYHRQSKSRKRGGNRLPRIMPRTGIRIHQSRQPRPSCRWTLHRRGAPPCLCIEPECSR